MMSDAEYMKLAIGQAKLAAWLEEVPVGAVIVKGGEVIASGYNLRESSKSSLAHAELIAIREACSVLGDWRLCDCTMYVTLEPCPMCIGAAINSRIDRICFGARDPKAGCCGSMLDLNAYPFNHQIEIVEGLLAEECGELLSDFFRNLRAKK